MKENKTEDATNPALPQGTVIGNENGGLEEMEWSCPNCQATWGIEEFDEQRCGCCGYPDNMDEEDNEEWDD